MAKHTELMHEALEGEYQVKLFWNPRSMNCFIVRVYHPASDWQHRYHCGSLRKAMHFIDVTLKNEIHLELHPPGCECPPCWEEKELRR